jgi:hypothetical protein
MDTARCGLAMLLLATGCTITEEDAVRSGDAEQDGEEAAEFSSAESALTITQPVSGLRPTADGPTLIPGGFVPRIRFVSCPLIRMDASTWTALPSGTDLPGNPASDVFFAPATFNGGSTSAAGISFSNAKKEVQLWENCVRTDGACTVKSGLMLWSDVVPAGDCQRVPVSFDIQGRFIYLNDPVEIHFQNGHFADSAVVRILASGDAYVRGATGAYTYLGAIPADGTSLFRITASYDPATHHMSVENAAGGLVELSGVDFHFADGNAAVVSILPTETSSSTAGITTLTSFGLRTVNVSAVGVVAY